MAKGPLVTDTIEALIASVHRKHPKWKAPMVRNEVSYILRKENPKLPAGWPSLSTVQKVLAIVRKKENELPEQDKPWSMAALDTYPLSPEATVSVLRVWKSRIEQEQGFTIREAKWAARLSALIEDIERLSRMASSYARLELIYQLIDRPFDSVGLDRWLMGLNVTITAKDDQEKFYPILALQEDAVDQIRDLQQGKTKGITIGKEQPPDQNLTKEQAIAKAEAILKKLKGGTQ